MATSAPPAPSASWRSSKQFILAAVTLGAFVDAVAYGVIIPFLPQIVEQYGGQDRDIGVLLAFFSAGVLVISPIMGVVSDRIASRRLPMVGGLAFLALATVLFMVGRSLWLLVTARFLQGVSGGAVWTVGLSLLADTYGNTELGVAMSIFFGIYSLGQLAGPPIGGLLYARLGYYAPFVLCAILVVIDLVVFLLIVEPPRLPAGPNHTPGASGPEQAVELGQASRTATAVGSDAAAAQGEDTIILKPDQPASARRAPKSILQILSVPAVIINLLLVAAGGTATAVFEGTLSLKLRDQFGFDVEQTGYVFMAVVGPGIIFTPLAGHIYDRVGLPPVSAVSVALAACMAPVLGITMPNIAVFVVVLFAFTACLIFGITPTLPEISACVPNTAFARTYGLFNMAFSVGFLIGPILGSVVYDKAGWFWVCISMLCLTAVCVPLALVYKRPVYAKDE
ncbi:hypothetical protein HK105_206993 [Polyrhizophydium stewartii]|uniref:Major facilitator superfamily (MFS) profile domain-containing protein n=1 Tax=Polyrhizophydium stewartii TaxID=2732419 RepID=A0ABR4N226_9FUNG|nr:hypothetical protein HK105_008095 [Polyrhizophydium stewartii]